MPRLICPTASALVLSQESVEFVLGEQFTARMAGQRTLEFLVKLLGQQMVMFLPEIRGESCLI